MIGLEKKILSRSICFHIARGTLQGKCEAWKIGSKEMSCKACGKGRDELRYVPLHLKGGNLRGT